MQHRNTSVYEDLALHFQVVPVLHGEHPQEACMVPALLPGQGSL